MYIQQHYSNNKGLQLVSASRHPKASWYPDARLFEVRGGVVRGSFIGFQAYIYAVYRNVFASGPPGTLALRARDAEPRNSALVPLFV